MDAWSSWCDQEVTENRIERKKKNNPIHRLSYLCVCSSINCWRLATRNKILQIQCLASIFLLPFQFIGPHVIASFVFSKLIDTHKSYIQRRWRHNILIFDKILGWQKNIKLKRECLWAFFHFRSMDLKNDKRLMRFCTWNFTFHR